MATNDDWCQWLRDDSDRICAAPATHRTSANRIRPHWRRACDHHAARGVELKYLVESGLPG